MRFGVHYLTTYFPELDGSAPQLYRRVFEQIQEAETLGFDDAWVTEHHFHRFGGLIPHPPTFLASLAAATSRIRLGVAISVVPLHDPLANAEAYAMVDVISNGRLEFGVGRGSNPEEYEGYGLGYEDSPQRLREHVDVLLQAWSDDSVNHKGDLYEYEDVDVLPKPVQRPHPPIWVGASRSDDTFRWAGEKGFHLMTLPYAYEPPVLQHWVGVYQDALRANGHDPATREILGKFHFFVAESDAAARRLAEPYWLNYYQLSFERNTWTMQHSPTAEDYEKQIAHKGLIVGDPERCIEAIQYWRETVGLTTLSAMVHFGGMPQELALQNLRLFGERILPAFSVAANPPTR
jgi:natural product biosynthesis luciferase-like monooxygenase protein